METIIGRNESSGLLHIFYDKIYGKFYIRRKNTPAYKREIRKQKLKKIYETNRNS